MNVFIKAGLLTVIVLAIGIQIGLWIESNKIAEIKSSLETTDLLFNDARMQSIYYQMFSVPNDTVFCNAALAANLKYNDMIYQRGLEIERYEASGKFTPQTLLDRKKYALLQFQFWMNAMQIKKKCGFNYHVVLHLWKYSSEDYNTNLDQKLQSAVLLELKEKCGPKLMLSNAPIDLNLTTIEMLADNYNISNTPAIVIDDDTILQGFQDLGRLSYYINCTA
ncbi:MAG: hypothetical protein HZB67_03850 [Candidatus Aenigmarchaeota archaeon]|nr:hypothetical protein [Candidatus Aenigmarchaeota archaeon]